MEEPSKRKRGKPLFEPTDDQRKAVEGMAAVGVPQDDIALVIEIDPKTLRLHFRRELDTGKIRANAKVGQSLFQQAVSGNTPAAIFWMKAQAGWREVTSVEVNDLTKLSNDEALQLRAIREKLAKP